MKCIKQIIPGMMMASIAFAGKNNGIRELVTSKNGCRGHWAYSNERVDNNRRMVDDEEAEESKLDLTEKVIESSKDAPTLKQAVSSESGSYSWSDSVSGEEIASGEDDSFLQKLKEKVIRELDPAIDAALQNALTKKNLDEYFVGTMQQEPVLAKAMNEDDKRALISDNDADEAKTADTAENDEVGSADIPSADDEVGSADIPSADDEPSIAIE